MSDILAVRDVVKTFDTVRAVDGVSFTVGRGTITGLLGRNGAGKTTTIRMITGIFYPDSGAIDWLGGDNGVAFRDRIGYLPEERGLYKQMKVMDQLLFLAEIKGKSPSKKEIDKWLDRFELGEKRNAKVEELSKGNQQKIQLIGALLHDPDLIILDEPQSGLDPVNMVLVRNLLRELRDEGKTILLSTHMMGEAEKMADAIVLIHQGKVVVKGRLHDVRASYGRNTLHMEFDGDGAFLRDIAGVRAAEIDAGSAQLTLAENADPQKILESAMARLKIQRFEIGSPSLEKIFIDKVGTETLQHEEAAR
ncbi:MAG TPA: ATP-binding cassette domain-containing protein [Thermoanaerobaculia bacterium]|nr:ATP-binding cassette domain-containing protein [Thermoanaerobaculia bacterium]